MNRPRRKTRERNGRRLYVRARRHAARITTALLCTLAAGCRGAQSALDPAGQQAARISRLWWLFFSITSVVFIVVMLFLLVAIFRGRRGRTQEAATHADVATLEPVGPPDPASERRMTRAVTAAVVLTTLILFVLLISEIFTGRAIYAVSNAPVKIRVTGRQWWWEVQYQDPQPSQIVTTANEIHIPVGQPIEFELNSTDVIHSFWIPNLHGKKDLIPGHATTTWFKADREGTFYGQCAEFCGYQHAHMRLMVVAESSEKFNAWLNAQRQSSVQPSNPSQQHGQQVFLSAPCIMCHTIQGTPANGRIGPNLTHLASRQTIAAVSLPNTRGDLGGWVLDSQKIKPGNHMPPNNLSPDELQALLDYLQSLK